MQGQKNLCKELLVYFALGNLAAVVVAVGRNMMRAFELAGSFIFDHIYRFERVVRTAHAT